MTNWRRSCLPAWPPPGSGFDDLQSKGVLEVVMKIFVPFSEELMQRFDMGTENWCRSIWAMRCCGWKTRRPGKRCRCRRSPRPPRAASGRAILLRYARLAHRAVSCVPVIE